MGRHRAHLDEQPAADITGKEAGRTLVDGIDGGGIGQDGDDGFGFAGKLRRGGGDRRTGLRDRLQPAGRSVPRRHLVTDFHEPLRNGCSHLADAGNSYLHAVPFFDVISAERPAPPCTNSAYAYYADDDIPS